MKGDVAASNADFEVAKEIKPSIAEEFTKVGVQDQAEELFLERSDVIQAG